MKKENLQPILNRIEVIDALRGFALAGIVLVHFVEQYVGAPTPEGAMDAVRSGTSDWVVEGLVNLLLRGKFFALFSILFGLSFYIQMNRAHSKGVDFRARFLWRLVILFVIGYLHHLFYRGDILTIYAILGMVLVVFHNVSNRWVLFWAGLMLLGVPRFLLYSSYGAGNFLSSVDYMSIPPEVTHYFETLKSGSIWQVFMLNGTEGQLMKIYFQFSVISRGYLTFGFFLIGMMLGRIGFFQRLDHFKPHVKKTLWVSLGSIVILIGAGILIFTGMGSDSEPNLDSWISMVGLTIFDLFNLALTAVILSLFLMAYQTVRGGRWLNQFSPYGRTALTNYVLQSVIGTYVFYGWGLNYLGEMRSSYAFLLSIAVVAVQMVLSNWWLREFKYGPLEWIWRVFTYRKRIGLVRESHSAD